MNHGTLTVLAPDRLKAEWAACENGKVCHQAGFDLVRKSK
jgi:hypothetical protein